MESHDISPKRRLRGTEEAELVEAAARLTAALEAVDRARTERDEVIADLMDDGVRHVDIADVLGITPKAVKDSWDRVR